MPPKQAVAAAPVDVEVRVTERWLVREAALACAMEHGFTHEEALDLLWQFHQKITEGGVTLYLVAEEEEHI